MKSGNSTNGSLSAREYRSILKAGEKAKRSVSFSDKNPNVSVHTVHHVESYKVYNSHKNDSCLKCSLF